MRYAKAQPGGVEIEQAGYEGTRGTRFSSMSWRDLLPASLTRG